MQRVRAGAPGTAVAVDVVVVSLDPDPDADRPVVLLRRRAEAPFAGAWSLPGSRVAPDEDLTGAAHRVLRSHGGLRGARHLEQLATFGRPDRDPRGRVVSVSYLALLPRPTAAGDPTRWWHADEPPELAFDHAEILASALERLRGKLTYSNVAYGLLGDAFTLSDLQEVYTSVLGRPLDKRNFRRRVLSVGMVAEAEGQRRGSHRPAQLYRFATDELVLLDDVIVT
ncbi:MAG: NUDIX hydrolase [Euzebyales bacterium]|nr:NUDIX hydrolase [Euzebyales bacterium]